MRVIFVIKVVIYVQSCQAQSVEIFFMIEWIFPAFLWLKHKPTCYIFDGVEDLRKGMSKFDGQHEAEKKIEME